MNLRFWCTTFIAFGAFACANARYVGSIGRDGTYANRGYGILLRLAEDGLSERWQAVDPSNPDRVPQHKRPVRHRKPLDLDGDGYVVSTETTLYFRPTLRLLSKTSTIIHIDIDVEIFGTNNRNVPLEALVAREAEHLMPGLASKKTALATKTARTLAGRYTAQVFSVGTSSVAAARYRVALIDHAPFEAEEAQTRRQIVKVILSAPRVTAALIEDHERILQNLYLNRKGSTTGTQEQW